MFKKNTFLILTIMISILSLVCITKILNLNEKKVIINNNIEKYESLEVGRKVIEVGKTTYYKSNADVITSCYSENTSFVNAFVSGGECIIRGIAPSSTDINVIAKTATSQITIKVAVLRREGSNDGFEINTSSNIIFAGGLNVDGSYTDYYNENTVMSQLCDTYSIKNEYSQTTEAQGKRDVFVSAYSAVETCDGANTKFAAVCIDPSKAGPTNTSHSRVSDYAISSSVNPKTLLGKVTSYVKSEIIGKYISINDFITNGTSNWRIASNMAIRIIDIYENGGSFSTSDPLVSKYYMYAEMAQFTFDNTNKKIKLGRALSDSTIQSNIESILSNALCGEVLNGKTAWSGCTFNNEKSSNNTIERIINSSTIEWDANLTNYKVVYNGHVILPSGTGTASFSPNCTLSGFSCSSTFSSPKTLTDGRKKYEFTVTVNGSTNATLPQTDEERKKISIAVKAAGLNPLSDAYILKPINGTDRQRLVLLNTAEPTVFLYFNATPNCNLESPALNYNNCTEQSCNAFNPELFSTAGCCELIPNKESYAYKYACESQSCVYTTFENVCNYSADPSTNASYVIREGVKAGNQESYSTCVIDVTQSDSPTKLDASGNSLMVAEFEDNRYCDISCKEDWEFELGSFGNFTGQNAVTAGTYFTLKNPIVVTGSRTCFTSFINYNGYLSDLTKHSKAIIDGYNSYVGAIANLEALLYPYSKTTSESFSATGGNLSITSDKYCSDYESYTDYVQQKVPDTMPFCEWDCLRTDPTGGVNYNLCHATCMANPSNRDKEQEVGTKIEYVPVTRYRCKDSEETAPLCYHISYSPSTVSYNKYSYDATSSTANSTVSVSIDTKNASSDITISGLGTEKFDAGKFGSGYKTTDGIKGTCPTSGVTGITFTDAGVAEYLESNVGSIYKTEISSSQSTIISNTQQIKEKSEAMFACQHWQLYNAADENNSKKTQNDILGANFMGETENASNWKRSYYTIKSAFDPQISYLYEEKEYMSMIGNNNLLVEDTERNDMAACNGTTEGCFDNSKSVNKANSTSLSNTTDTCYPYKYKIEQPDGTTTDAVSYICHNYVKAWYYDTSDANGNTTAWRADSTEGKTYSQAGNDKMVEDTHKIALCTITSGSIYGSGKDGSFIIKRVNDNKFHGGTCTNNYITYVKANYIKQTIKDGSIYKITGKWYTKDGEDVKAFSSDGTKEKAMHSALETSRSSNNKSYWSPIGTFATFPIKITTRRNMYQYLFSFGQVGSFSNGSLGRIMGTSTSIIKINNTSCFYEVKEELCECCGEPIDSTIDTISGITTKEYIKQNGISYNESDYDIISKNAQLGYYFSVISLNDLNTDVNRELAQNWKTSEYLIDGYDNHTTTKGEYLAKELSIIGENAYNIKPEYAFVLTPTAMSEVRSHNDMFGYEVNLDTFIAYGLSSVEPINDCYNDIEHCDWGLNDVSKFENGEHISFVHYGSKFLEGTLSNARVNMKSYWKYTPNNLLSSNKVCAILEKDYKKAVDDTHTEPVLQSLINSGCRWIDYIDDDYDEIDGKNQYYRLSFK